jgi:outer membrane protein TolC
VLDPLGDLRGAGARVRAAQVDVALLGGRVPQLGQSAGMTNSTSEPSRRSTTGATTSGMTSPALRSTTVSPMSTPLRTTSEALCRVARATVDPATRTGSITAYGVTRPVRPTSTRMSRSFVVTSSGGNL